MFAYLLIGYKVILKAIKNTTANNFKHENQKPVKEEEESNE